MMTLTTHIASSTRQNLINRMVSTAPVRKTSIVRGGAKVGHWSGGVKLLRAA